MIRILAILFVSPLLLSHFFLSRLSSSDASLEPHSQVLSLLPGKTGSLLRVAFYRFALEQCDPTVTIGFGVLFSKTGCRIGRHVYIGPRCQLGLVTLEEDVLLAPAVQIPSGPNTHGIDQLDVPIRVQPGDLRRVNIGRDCWVGASAIVLANIREQTVVAAGSVVTRDLPSRVVAGGIPAAVIRTREVRSKDGVESSGLGGG
ncbi:MAG: acyltransferase [Planctomycetota bacterium]